jgi:hypothetical protein
MLNRIKHGIFAILMLLPGVGFAQIPLELPTSSSPINPTALPLNLAPGVYSDEQWRIKLEASPGYQWLNWVSNIKYPIPANIANERLPFEAMKLTLQDSDYWVGFAGIELQPDPNILGFARVGGNIPKDVSTVRMDASGVYTWPAGLNGANSVSPWFWDTRFQWWMAEAGAVLKVASAWGLEAGFRWEHYDFKLTNPRNETLEIPGRVDPNGRTLP